MKLAMKLEPGQRVEHKRFGTGAVVWSDIHHAYGVKFDTKPETMWRSDEYWQRYLKSAQ